MSEPAKALTFFAMKSKKYYLFVLVLSVFSFVKLEAHPMPNSVLLLDVYQTSLKCKIQIPIKEMELAVSFDMKNRKNLNTKNAILVNYLNQHFKIIGNENKVWKTILTNISVETAEQNATGKYDELVVDYLIFPIYKDPRQFTIYYNAVIHQVNSHRALVSIRNDWETGSLDEESNELGVIAYSIDEGTALPFKVDLQKGSNWIGFKSMVRLGMKHISEGTDHLMFLLVLLLTAPLICIEKKWRTNPSVKKSLSKILKITIAFTIGHSLTLMLATLKVITFPTKLIEIVIAVSILVTALHVIKPLFPDKENIIAGVFGLIHGLAFSTVLSELQLTNERLVLSLLGFNMGIELMQLIVIFLVIPWFLLISRYRIYKYYKSFLALLAIVASIFWIMERVTEKQNLVSRYIDIFAKNSILFVVFLFISFFLFFLFKFEKNDSYK